MTIRLVPILLAGMLAAPAIAQEAPLTGDQVFKQRCSLCHSVKTVAVPTKAVAVGPNLAGIVGRTSGTAKFAYSPALVGAKLPWTKANLDKYLAAPTKLVPGTRMVIALSDAKQRRAVIDYLATVK
jgi:cytochrome c